MSQLFEKCCAFLNDKSNFIDESVHLIPIFERFLVLNRKVKKHYDLKTYIPGPMKKVKKGTVVWVNPHCISELVINHADIEDPRFDPSWKYYDCALIYLGRFPKSSKFSVSICKTIDTNEIIQVPTLMLTPRKSHYVEEKGEVLVLDNLINKKYNGKVIFGLPKQLRSERKAVFVYHNGKKKKLSVKASTIESLHDINERYSELYRNTVLDVFPSLKCPLSWDVFVNPVLAPDGQTYSSEPLFEWCKQEVLKVFPRIDLHTFSDIEQFRFVIKSPLTNIDFDKDVNTTGNPFVPNYVLQSLMDSLFGPYYSEAGKFIACTMAFV